MRRFTQQDYRLIRRLVDNALDLCDDDEDLAEELRHLGDIAEERIK